MADKKKLLYGHLGGIAFAKRLPRIVIWNVWEISWQQQATVDKNGLWERKKNCSEQQHTVVLGVNCAWRH